LDKRQQMTAINLLSKACLLAEKMEDNEAIARAAFDNQIERLQFMEAAEQVRPLLAMLDRQWPGLMPIPHDGVPWKKRVDADSDEPQ
jgi:hypothetical protein